MTRVRFLVMVMKTEKHGDRIVNAIIDRLPPAGQEAGWGWWNKK